MDTQSMALSGNERKLMGTLCLLIIFGNINMTMFNLSIPSISADFALTSSQVSWVMVGYSILMAIGAGTYGKLTESFSFRQLYVIGLILLAFGSMIGFFAASYLQVIIGRLLQAAGASSISPLSYAAVTLYFKPTVKGRVLGTLSATIAFAFRLRACVRRFRGAILWLACFVHRVQSEPICYPYDIQVCS
ncbi:MFS transporter [Paenibacillus jamilae]|uniref:MFS transporter n=1 Tax=Paenibacillus jamilae TaxID=114136 RepID=UPI003D2B4500